MGSTANLSEMFKWLSIHTGTLRSVVKCHRVLALERRCGNSSLCLSMLINGCHFPMQFVTEHQKAGSL